MAARKPPATAEEVVAAVASMSERGNGVRFYSALTIAGLVAQQRGCPDSWPDRDAITKYVSLSSVKKVLGELVAEGKLYAVTGKHWAIHQRVARATFYIDDVVRKTLIRRHTELVETRRSAERDEWVSEKLHKRYAMIVEELANEWDRDNPPEDWEARW